MIEEMQNMQQGGFCFAYFRNTQNCIQNSMANIQNMQMALTKLNQEDMADIQRYTQEAQKYAEWEKEGKRYVASVTGEEIPQEAPAPKQDRFNPSAYRTNQDSAGNYQFNLGAMNTNQQQMGNQQWMGNQQQMGNQQWMGNQQQNMNGMQFSNPFNRSSNFGFNGQMGMGGQTQMGLNNYTPSSQYQFMFR